MVRAARLLVMMMYGVSAKISPARDEPYKMISPYGENANSVASRLMIDASSNATNQPQLWARAESVSASNAPIQVMATLMLMNGAPSPVTNSMKGIDRNRPTPRMRMRSAAMPSISNSNSAIASASSVPRQRATPRMATTAMTSGNRKLGSKYANRKF